MEAGYPIQDLVSHAEGVLTESYPSLSDQDRQLVLAFVAHRVASKEAPLLAQGSFPPLEESIARWTETVHETMREVIQKATESDAK